uniref:SxtJ n=1 Tax=Candidatus Kentrum sp. SD TaxID=2126332 RepID=A0A451BMM7_9GAMM|nr:MAG: hypothetical protein BECKSD772D_GA0070982_105412 [Candidatus Kentron sp. SD]
MKFSEVELPSNRKFGFFFTAIFLIIGLYFLSGESASFSYVLFCVAALFSLVTLVRAELLLPLNKLWLRLGLLLGMIVSPIVLGVIFFGLFTPISLLMKLFGRDELRLKLEARGSHWKSKEMTSSPSESFKHQF